MSLCKHGRHLPAFILLFLTEEPAYGLALVKKMQQKLPYNNIDHAATYRALKDLEKINAVTSYWDTSNPGPAKKWYKITDVGLEKLKEFKEDIILRKKNLEFFVDCYESLFKKHDS